MDDVTLVSMRVRASNGLASDAITKMGFDVTRLLPNGKDSSNPAVVYEDIVTNGVYGAMRPASELDTPAISELETWAKTQPGFNAIFDFSTGVWDAITTVLRPYKARPVTLGPLFSQVIDKPRTPVAVFTDSNEDQKGAIVLDSMEFGWQFAQEGEEDGFEIEYRDPRDWIARYVRYPANCVNPLQENLMGCTDPAQALDYAEYKWRLREYRREFLTFQVELEGHLVQVGDRITLDHGMTQDDYVVGAVRPSDQYRVTLETFNYSEDVWA